MKFKKMNQTWKKKWVTALLSNKYKQGTGDLCMHDLDGNRCYCCLGVLKHIKTKKNDYVNSYYGSSCGLNYDIQYKLAKMNDTGKSFKSIAKWINKYL